MKYLVSNGCSFTEGTGLVPSPPGQYSVAINLEDIKFEKTVKPYRYSGILSKKLGIEDINLSRGGASNERIFGTTIDWIEENIEKCNDTLFVIQWSYIGRDIHEKFAVTRELIKKAHENKVWKIDNISIRDFIYSELDYLLQMDFSELRKRDMRFVYSLQNIFKLNNWKYVFFEGHSFEDEETRVNLDWDTHIGLLIDKNYLIRPGFMDFVGEKILPDLHPNKEGHVDWANKLYDFIKDKRWL